MAMRLMVVMAASVGLAFGQTAGPGLTIDAAGGRHAISADIYGINFYWDGGGAAAPGLRPTVRRWGGNLTSTYHWKFDVANHDSDWYYEVLPETNPNVAKLPEGSSFNAFVDQARMTGGKAMGTIPILGWLPKARMELCSYEVGKYGDQ